jgi:uncharacterized lipoprotein YddW (UPF0748 family)
MSKYSGYLFLYIVLFFNVLKSQPAGSTSLPKQEVRAVWLSTVAGLDWPRTTDIEEQKRSLLEIVQKIKDANFNTIFFQVRARGDAMYKSNYEPWSDRLTGTLGQDPGWDPLEFILRQAHARGIEVHAWFNTFRVRNGIARTAGNKKHVAEVHPDWISTVDGEVWLNPGIPEVCDYLVTVAMDLVKNYDIDGIHFDFIRYPGGEYPDQTTYKLYGKGLRKDDWRRENINRFVREFYDSATAVKPMLKVGSAPIGIYRNIPNANGWQSYSAIYQDSRRWLQENKHDYLAPQVYWTLGNQKSDPDFAVLAKDWSENSYGKHIYIGLGAYKPEVFEQLPLLIDVTRLYGNKGNSFFRYDFIKNNLNFGGRYMYPANIPPMPWKDSIPPNPPTDLNIAELTTGTYKLEWKSPGLAKDHDLAKYFNIYRSTTEPVNIKDPRNIVAITTTNDTVFIDKILRPKSANYYYIVTAFDEGNNESLPALEQKVEIPVFANLVREITPKFRLAHLLKESPSTLYVTYEVEKKGMVVLKILDTRKNELQVLVDDIQDVGRYIVTIDPGKIKTKLVVLTLITGKYVYSQNLTLNE